MTFFFLTHITHFEYKHSVTFSYCLPLPWPLTSLMALPLSSCLSLSSPAKPPIWEQARHVSFWVWFSCNVKNQFHSFSWEVHYVALFMCSYYCVWERMCKLTQAVLWRSEDCSEDSLPSFHVWPWHGTPLSGFHGKFSHLLSQLPGPVLFFELSRTHCVRTPHVPGQLCNLAMWIVPHKH